MSYRASPPRSVPGFALSEADESAAVPSASDFVNLFRSQVTHKDGYAQGEFALMPDLAQYDRVRFLFQAAPDTVTSATLTVWAMGSEGIPYVVGATELGANGQFPAVEFDNHQATYCVRLSEFDGTGLDVITFVQGFYETPYTRG